MGSYVDEEEFGDTAAGEMLGIMRTWGRGWRYLLNSIKAHQLPTPPHPTCNNTRWQYDKLADRMPMANADVRQRHTSRGLSAFPLPREMYNYEPTEMKEIVVL